MLTWNLFPQFPTTSFLNLSFPHIPPPPLTALSTWLWPLLLKKEKPQQNSLNFLLLFFLVQGKRCLFLLDLDCLISCALGALYHHLPSHVLLAFPINSEPWSNFSHLKNTLTPKQNPPLTFSPLNLLQSLPLLPISPVKYHQRLSLFKYCFFTSQTLLNPLHLAGTVLPRHHPLHWLDPHVYSILLSHANSQQASSAYHKLPSETISPWAATGSEHSYPFFVTHLFGFFF